jgi:basic membrane protein A
MRKIVFTLVAVILCAGIIAGCKPSGTARSSGGQANVTAMIVSIPQGDPFLTLAFSGVQRLAAERGIQARIIEALDKSEYREVIRAMAEAGANPIFMVWDDLSFEAFAIAEQFPNTKFIAVDTYSNEPLPNVKTIVVEPQEASFIAGYLAAKTSKNNRVAWLGSVDMPVINRFRAGFEAGARYGNPDVFIESLYIGDPNDPIKGGELARQVIGKGADVLMHSANQAGLGVIRASEEMGVRAIGVDQWQGAINEEVVFWSALKDIAGAIYAAGLSALDGSFSPGVEVYGIDSGILLYDPRDFNKLTPDLQKEVLNLSDKIRLGEIRVPAHL